MHFRRTSVLAAMAVVSLSTMAADSEGVLSTLYSRDALSHTLCFGDGRYGKVVQDNQVKNRCSDIDFGGYIPGAFSVGVEGARIAAIVDVGTEEELAEKYGFEQTVGQGNGFASIRLKLGKLVISKDRKQGSVQEMSDVGPLYGPLQPGAHAVIRAGHVYVLRITDRYDKARDMFVKLYVVSHTPGESVTFRWQTL